jgi:hypothetical protein
MEGLKRATGSTAAGKKEEEKKRGKKLFAGDRKTAHSSGPAHTSF